MEHEKTFLQRLGEKAKELRLASGMTQGEVAQKASELLPGDEKIYRPDLSAFEKKGEKITSASKINAIFSLFNYEWEPAEKKTSLSAVSI